jgi:hypothetical protein
MKVHSPSRHSAASMNGCRFCRRGVLRLWEGASTHGREFPARETGAQLGLLSAAKTPRPTKAIEDSAKNKWKVFFRRSMDRTVEPSIRPPPHKSCWSWPRGSASRRTSGFPASRWGGSRDPCRLFECHARMSTHKYRSRREYIAPSTMCQRLAG